MADEAPLHSNNPIRFGIVGCAEVARKLARAMCLAPGVTLCAIGSRSIEKAEKFAALIGLSGTQVKLYGSYDQVLDDPCVDAVYLPLPTSLHTQWAVKAAHKKKHLLLEKPAALNVAELDRILEACQSNGVQFMDGTMWLHHPRTLKMKNLLSDSKTFGPINYIHSTSTMSVNPEFLETNIRVRPDLDALGALGDLGWYCIGAILWAKDYQLPSTVQALPDVTTNSAGVILSFTASFHWGISSNNSTATIHCSFFANSSMDLAISGSNASIHTKDFIIPYQEDWASFELSCGAQFADLHIGWNVIPEEVRVDCELPQEASMVKEFSRLVHGIARDGVQPNSKWPEISRKTQLVLDAVKKSIDRGCKLVQL
ncbi:uncharacterized oxidoreductase At4g09670-like [Humulus lupulus]|uniref:uncharacterized oxidoreductase At4g09670-like n=1 Tax=Humulus lupulus TaxID=3486 RepID=UPI002B404C67|nr:uncharacterized oxidoreductase At4g09670-like [Humulus lupulus]